MPGPSSASFAGTGQRDGVTTSSSSSGRGRGSHSRLAPYQNRTLNNNNPGRGRGVGIVHRGRGEVSAIPAGTRNFQGGRSDGVAKKVQLTSSNSPFAQLKQQQTPPRPTAQLPANGNKPSSFASVPVKKNNNNPGGFGAPSVPNAAPGFSVGWNQDRRRRRVPRPSSPMATGSVPVEDVGMMSGYHERYEKLKLDRARQRTLAIKEGQMTDPTQPTSLNQAITPVGTCMSMCPEFERVERIVQKMVDKSEKFLHPVTNSHQNMESKMLKRFRRSAAGYDEQLPSDIRTPKTLLQTMNYLIRHVIGSDEPLGVIHKFVWDRTRSIRNDLSIQQLTQEDHVTMAVTCLERIARFHIVSLHLLSSPSNQEPFDHHQEREQLNNTLLSLIYYYDDNRGRVSFPNEDEFRAYYVVFSIHDQRPDLEARVQKWPSDLCKSPRVQIALELFTAASNSWEYQGTLDSKRENVISQGFYTRFFSLVDSPGVSYLMACVAEIYFNYIRQTAIRSIWKAYCRQPLSQQQKNDEWTMDELTDGLFFDNTTQTLKFCEEQDLTFAKNGEGQLYLNWASRPVDSVEFKPSSQHVFSQKHVESKRAGRTLVAIILGLNIRQAASQGMIDNAILAAYSDSLRPSTTTKTSAKDENLFVSDDENGISAPRIQVNGVPQEDMDSDESLSTISTLSNTSTYISKPAPQDHPSTVEGEGESQITEPLKSESSEPKETFSSIFNASKRLPSASTSSQTPSNPFAFLSTPPASSPMDGQSSQTTDAPPPVNRDEEPSSLLPAKGDMSSLPQTDKTPSTTVSGQVEVAKSSPLLDLKPTRPFSIAAAISDATSSLTSNPENVKPVSIFDNMRTDSQNSQITSFNTGGLTQSTEPKPNQSPNLTPKPKDASQPVDNIANGVSIFNTQAAHQENGRVAALLEKRINESATVPNGRPPVQLSGSNLLAEPSPAEPLMPKWAHSSAKETGVASRPDQSNFSVADGPLISAGPTFQSPTKSLGSVEATQVQTVADRFSSPGSRFSTEPPLVGDELTDSQGASRRYAWLEALRDFNGKRREERPTSRKRALDENEEQSAIDENSGAQRTSEGEGEEARPHRSSIFRASIAPLPTLPILEEVRKMTERNQSPEVEASTPAQSCIDEDEILLSSARIVAESLKHGRSLIEGTPEYLDPLHASRHLATSSSPASRASRSQSPYFHVNGHDIALAPDTPLGLGRTMSRTEQRIRLTGGKGLAYKPLKPRPKQSKRKGKTLA